MQRLGYFLAYYAGGLTELLQYETLSPKEKREFVVSGKAIAGKLASDVTFYIPSHSKAGDIAEQIVSIFSEKGIKASSQTCGWLKHSDPIQGKDIRTALTNGNGTAVVLASPRQIEEVLFELTGRKLPKTASPVRSSQFHAVACQGASWKGTHEIIDTHIPHVA